MLTVNRAMRMLFSSASLNLYFVFYFQFMNIRAVSAS